MSLLNFLVSNSIKSEMWRLIGTIISKEPFSHTFRCLQSPVRVDFIKSRSILTISMKLFHKTNIGLSSEHIIFSSNVSCNSNSSSRLADLERICVTRSVRFYNSDDSKNFAKTSFFCSPFNHLP